MVGVQHRPAMARLRFVRNLLAVAALSLLRCGDSAPSTANEQPPLFRESAAETGLDFHHFPGATGRFHRDGSYLSSSEPVAYFGLSNSAEPSHIDVEWAAGGRERYTVETIGATLALVQGAGSTIH